MAIVRCRPSMTCLLLLVSLGRSDTLNATSSPAHLLTRTASYFGFRGRLSVLCPGMTVADARQLASGWDLTASLHLVAPENASRLLNGNLIACGWTVTAVDFISSILIEDSPPGRGGRITGTWAVLCNGTSSCATLARSTKTDVGERLFFVDLASGTVTESYTLSRQRVEREVSKLDFADSPPLTTLANTEQRTFRQRRSDLLGQEIVTLTEGQVPHVKINQGTTRAPTRVTTPSGDVLEELAKEDFTGSAVDILRQLEADMNFSARVLRRQDRKWGDVRPDGSWTGMLGSVQKGEADLLAAPITNTDYRTFMVDFLPAMGTETNAVAISREEILSQAYWELFFSPFATDLWVFVTASSLFLGVAVTFIGRCRPHASSFSLLDIPSSSWVAFSSNFGVDMSKLLPALRDDHLPTRLLMLSVFLTGAFVYVAYRGALTSELSVRKASMPFGDLASLLRSDFRLITRELGHAVFNDFKRAPPESDHGKLYAKHLAAAVDEDGNQSTASLNVLFPSTASGLAFLMSAPRTAFYNIKEVMEEMPKYSCRIAFPWVSGAPNHVSMALPKNSPYSELFRYHMTKVIEDGRLRVSLSRWTSPAADCRAEGEAGSEDLSLGMVTLAWPFVMLGAAAATAVLVMAAERLRGGDGRSKSGSGDSSCGRGSLFDVAGFRSKFRKALAEMRGDEEARRALVEELVAALYEDAGRTEIAKSKGKDGRRRSSLQQQWRTDFGFAS